MCVCVCVCVCVYMFMHVVPTAIISQPNKFYNVIALVTNYSTNTSGANFIAPAKSENSCSGNLQTLAAKQHQARSQDFQKVKKGANPLKPLLPTGTCKWVVMGSNITYTFYDVLRFRPQIGGIDIVPVVQCLLGCIGYLLHLCQLGPI